MHDDTASIHFFGDLSDPWVAEIADALPEYAGRTDCPDSLPLVLPSADILVVHRANLGSHDGEILRSGWENGSRIFLCIGPHVRARDLERLGHSVELVLNEATASAMIGRHVAASWVIPTRNTLPMLVVVAAGFEVRTMLVEAAETAGFPARGFSTWNDATPSRLAIWDVPVLEPNWERQIIEPARRRSVLAVIGFATRETVAAAREAGASACLDFPCDVADLAFVLDRLSTRESTSILLDGPHLVPPPPRVGLRVVRPPVADRTVKP